MEAIWQSFNTFFHGNALYYAVRIFGGLTAVSFHEFAHAYTAYKLGDPTAKEAGRLTLNPIKHIDIIGLISFVLLGFGWAKPVPVNVMNFRNQRSGIRLVSFAGPMANFLLLGVFALLAKLSYNTGNQLMLDVAFTSVLMNAGSAIFNLFPFPPLDGSKILASFLPLKAEAFFYNYEHYFIIIFVVLVVTNLIDYIVYPPIYLIVDLLESFIVS